MDIGLVLGFALMSIIPATPNTVSQMAHFPKYGTVGTLIPNRIFVGGIASDVSDFLFSNLTRENYQKCCLFYIKVLCYLGV